MLLLIRFLDVPAYTFSPNSYWTNKDWSLSKKFVCFALVNKDIVLDTGKQIWLSGLWDRAGVLNLCCCVCHMDLLAQVCIRPGATWWRGRAVPLLKAQSPRHSSWDGLLGRWGFQHEGSTRCREQLSLHCIHSKTKILTSEESKCH